MKQDVLETLLRIRSYMNNNNSNVEKYRKVKGPQNVEEKLPFADLPTNVIHMKVRPGSRIRQILDFAIAHFKPEECRNIVFSGSGSGVTKTISCVEIMKRIFKDIYQQNKICYHKIEDEWKPTISELDSLKVTREIPALYVWLSKDPLKDDTNKTVKTNITSDILEFEDEDDSGESDNNEDNCQILFNVKASEGP